MNTKAKESSEIQKVRKKIKQKIQQAEQKMNPEALIAMGRLIKEQLNRKKEGRISLKERQFTFDENRHPAKTQNKFILKLIRQIKHPAEHGLEGRIKTIKKPAK